MQYHFKRLYMKRFSFIKVRYGTNISHKISTINQDIALYYFFAYAGNKL